MENDIQIMNQQKHSYEEKIKAAYALNLCTVSVSQIVDYKDMYILEQEYDAILNNLNLKQIPKDEALLRILSELLNTITFFRIQEVKKSQIEKKYQRRLNSAIWSAVPSLSVVVSGNPVAIALSLATQIGSGYMNYRKEKANAGFEKEDAEIELQITAIEQVNALRRELFTTAWRLADEYDFEDEWRLTEKQIKQYNEILLDNDEFRKYARMEAIADRFIAYPPFWYFYGHTANYIAMNAREELKKSNTHTSEEITAYYKLGSLEKEYTKRAKEHFEHYYILCENNILREDQMAASCALEYVDLLWAEEQPDLEKISKLLNLAEKMSPNAFDILQLCAISYLKVGKTEDATRLLKILVNEEYNMITNARILSRLYVTNYVNSKDYSSLSNYNILERQVDPQYLYPMPKGHDGNQINLLEEKFISKQKAILKKAYRHSLDAFVKKQINNFNAVLVYPDEAIADWQTYYSNTDAAKSQRKRDVKKKINADNMLNKEYVSYLKNCGFRNKYITILNQTIAGIEMFSCFRELDSHDRLIKSIEGKIRLAKNPLAELQEKMDKLEFSFDDYLKLVDDYSYQYFTENFFNNLKSKMVDTIDAADQLGLLEKYDQELSEFCVKYDLPMPEEYLHMYKPLEKTYTDNLNKVFFVNELLGEIGESCNYEEKVKLAKGIIESDIHNIVQNPDKIGIYLFGENGFNSYFDNANLGSTRFIMKEKSFAVIDDKTRSDYDLVLGVDGITIILENRVVDTVCYKDITYEANGNKSKLRIGFPEVYTNKNVDILALNEVISKLKAYLQNK